MIHVMISYSSPTGIISLLSLSYLSSPFLTCIPNQPSATSVHNPRLCFVCDNTNLTGGVNNLHTEIRPWCPLSPHHPLKVDMFSYGMVLYELLSGRRPALGQHQLQIAKKLSKGIRPMLGSPEEVQFCCLHSLLTECWDTKPEKVSLPAV